MKKRKRRLLLVIIVCAGMVFGYTLFDKDESTTILPKQAADGTVEIGGEVAGSIGSEQENGQSGEASNNPETPVPSEAPDSTENPDSSNGNAGNGQTEQTEDGMAVIAEPADVAVLVNKLRKLPNDYNPTDLVYPDVQFIFSEKIEKRKMRQAAATALEKMFKAAEDEGIKLAGVSAYRSHDTQTKLFERYVKRDGLEKARTYSAFPGTSEHETGLAIDISGSDGKCAAADCFADTKEALWLEEHAHKHGFIIRYLKGKEDITGYQYEPWHMRFVGEDVASELKESGETLEEYYDAVPVTK